MNREQYLRAELDAKIEQFKAQSDRHKHIYRRLRYAVFGLTALSTVLASAAMSAADLQQWLNLCVVVASALAGLASSVEGLRKPADLWIHERSVYFALLDLRRQIDFLRSDGGELPEIERHFERLQQILASSRQDWSSKVAPRQGAGAGG